MAFSLQVLGDMKDAQRFREFVTILPLILCLFGCGASVTLQVEKTIPAAPIRPISLTLLAAPGVPLSADELHVLRERLVESLAWEGGLRVGENDSFKVVGTVTHYERGVPMGQWSYSGMAPSSFDSDWVVLDEHDREIGRARINGGLSFSKLETNDTVLERVGERLSDFLTKQHAATPTP